MQNKRYRNKHNQRFCLGVELALVEWKGYYQRRGEESDLYWLG